MTSASGASLAYSRKVTPDFLAECKSILRFLIIEGLGGRRWEAAGRRLRVSSMLAHTWLARRMLYPAELQGQRVVTIHQEDGYIPSG